MLADNGQGEWRVAVPSGWTNLAFFKLAAINDVVDSLARPRRRDAGGTVPGTSHGRGAALAAQTDTLLRYRPWRGVPRGPLFASLAMARVSLKLMARRKLLWGLFALGLLVFFFFFYAQYLVVWITNQLATETVRFAGIPVTIGNLTKFLERLNLNGTAHTFGNFVWFQGYVLVIVLALPGRCWWATTSSTAACRSTCRSRSAAGTTSSASVWPSARS